MQPKETVTKELVIEREATGSLLDEVLERTGNPEAKLLDEVVEATESKPKRVRKLTYCTTCGRLTPFCAERWANGTIEVPEDDAVSLGADDDDFDNRDRYQTIRSYQHAKA